MAFPGEHQVGKYLAMPSSRTTYTIPSTPLTLHRDWSENYPTSLGGLHDDAYDDFQSNHIDFEEGRPSSLLAGLGIRNIDLAHAKALADSSSSNMDVSPKASSQDCPLELLYPTSPMFHGTTREKLYGELPLPGMDSTPPLTLASPWSFSSAGSLLETCALSSIKSELSLSPELIADKSTRDLETDLSISFEHLSAATGLSLADFAAHISATAEATLKRMAGEDFSSVDSALDSHAGQYSSDFIKWPISNTPRLLVDARRRRDKDCKGVNPADILPPDSPPPSDSQYMDHSDSLPSLQNSVTEDMSDMCPTTRQTSLDQDEVQARERHDNYQQLYFPQPSPRKTRHVSDDERSLFKFESPSSSEYCSPSLRPTGQKRNSRISTRRIARATVSKDPVHDSPGYQNDCEGQHLLPVNLGTPVFDAHRGVDIEVLKGKAERYRLRNQGREYDKRWLISFAGKLSAKGELVEEFRCYVMGCKQANKRRDHILIHVGAHLDQRPFKCMHCDSRFLRKNECKRHELSHTGVRPFSCNICPYPGTTFVRQDLLKRHMKRTHRIDFKAEKENNDCYRPKKRARYCR